MYARTYAVAPLSHRLDDNERNHSSLADLLTEKKCVNVAIAEETFPKLAKSGASAAAASAAAAGISGARC